MTVKTSAKIGVQLIGPLRNQNQFPAKFSKTIGACSAET